MKSIFLFSRSFLKDLLDQHIFLKYCTRVLLRMDSERFPTMEKFAYWLIKRVEEFSVYTHRIMSSSIG